MRIEMKFFGLMLIFTAIKCGESHTVDLIVAKSSLISTLRYQFMFPLMDVVGPGLELALTSCQRSFKWDRWNCPSNDFLSKRVSKHFDRESAYVTAITTAALMYTITKSCSSGRIPGCGCTEEHSSEFVDCSDNLKYAEESIGIILHSRPQESLDVQAYAILHNERAAKVLLRRSLHHFCRCDGEQLPCAESKCLSSLRPFAEIANDIRLAYENALVTHPDSRGEVNWNQFPEDVLVYVDDSPNYCSANAILGWTGTRGRLCSREKGKNVSLQERFSCRNLCRSCGLRIRSHSVIRQKRCNCDYSWCFEVKCDVCVKVEKQYYCE